jgi:restriction endonuclease S subunit
MSGEWEVVELGEVASVRSGYAFKGSDWTDAGIPVVKIANVKGGRLEMSSCSFVDESTAAEARDFRLRAGDILIAMTGYIGEVARVREADLPCVLNQRVGKFSVSDEKRVDSEYLYALLTSSEMRQTIESLGYGSAQPNVSPSLIHKVEIPLPPLPEQRRIAKILGDLDDKIELNRTMNETLEQMARALFKSWFVDFDPVRAKMEGRTPSGMDAATAALFPDRLVDSELGPIPEGWEVGSLGQIIDCFDSKRIPLSGRQREARPGTFPYYGAASIMDFIDGYLFDGVYLLVGEDGSVINEDGTPVIQYAWGKFWVNNHAHVLQAKNGFCTEHLLLLMKDMNIAAYVTGAVQPKLNQGNLFRIPLVIPPEVIGDAFADAIKPSYGAIRHNVNQSRALSTLRDTLLPKLVGGEVRA